MSPTEIISMIIEALRDKFAAQKTLSDIMISAPQIQTS